MTSSPSIHDSHRFVCEEHRRGALDSSDTEPLEVGSVGHLVGGRMLERPRGIRHRVLFHDKPARVTDGLQLINDSLDLIVAFPDTAERPAPPDRLDWSSLRDYALQCMALHILQMEVVDPAGPSANALDRVPTAHHQMAGVEAEPDITPFERALNLPRSLEVRAGVVVQRRLITSLAASLGHARDSFGKLTPACIVPAEAALPCSSSGPPPSFR